MCDDEGLERLGDLNELKLEVKGELKQIEKICIVPESTGKSAGKTLIN